MAYEVGSIFYKLGIDTTGFDTAQAKVKSKLDGVGSSLASFGAKATKYGAIAGVAVAGLAIKGGFDRALKIEDAQKKLEGLGHTTQSIQTIMDSALKSVKGTAFSLDAAATAAASAVASGVEPGKELTRVLGLTADTATITGRSFDEAGAIINKVLAKGKISMEEVNQLTDAGMPILQQLAKEYGVTAGEMAEMVSRGEVDSKRFLNAIETNIGGAALKSGETTRGAFENMKAAISRSVADVVQDYLPKIRDGMKSITKWVDDHKEGIRTAFVAVATAFKVVFNIVMALVGLGSTVVGFFERNRIALAALAGALGMFLIPMLVMAIANFAVLIASLIATGAAWLVAFWPILLVGAAIGALAYLIVTNWETVKNFFTGLFDWFKNNWPLLLAILTGPFGLAVLFIIRHWETIKSWFFGAIGWFKDAGEKIGNGIANGISGAVEGVKNTIKAALNWIIDKANTAIRGVNKVSPPGIPEIGQIPRFNSGVQNFEGGLAYVHKGEVLANLAPGTSVIKASDVPKMGGNTMNINIGEIGNMADADYLVSRINRNYELAGLGISPVGG